MARAVGVPDFSIDRPESVSLIRVKVPLRPHLAPLRIAAVSPAIPPRVEESNPCVGLVNKVWASSGRRLTRPLPDLIRPLALADEITERNSDESAAKPLTLSFPRNFSACHASRGLLAAAMFCQV